MDPEFPSLLGEAAGVMTTGSSDVMIVSSMLLLIFSFSVLLSCTHAHTHTRSLLFGVSFPFSEVSEFKKRKKGSLPLFLSCENKC